MKIRLALTTLALLVLAVPPAVAAQSRPPAANTVVVYDKEGGNITPPEAFLLTVYNSGLAVLARRDGTTVSTGKICTASADAARVTELRDQLAAAGAFFLPDNPLSVIPDTGVATLTFFVARPNTGRARSNTFSYGVRASAPYLQADQAVQSFIADIFPGC